MQCALMNTNGEHYISDAHTHINQHFCTTKARMYNKSTANMLIDIIKIVFGDSEG